MVLHQAAGFCRLGVPPRQLRLFPPVLFEEMCEIVTSADQGAGQGTRRSRDPGQYRLQWWWAGKHSQGEWLDSPCQIPYLAAYRGSAPGDDAWQLRDIK
jgi:hypothetical protein